MPSWMRGRFSMEAELGSGTFACVFLARDLAPALAAEPAPLVACKVSRGAEHVTAALHEAAVMRKLRHPHIVRLHHVLTPAAAEGRHAAGCAEAPPGSARSLTTSASTGEGREGQEKAEELPAETCLVLSAALGRSLHCTVSSSGPLTVEAVGMLGLQLASALAYLASPERNVVHLDLKPANIVFAKPVPALAHTSWQQVADRRTGPRPALQAQICDFGLCVELDGPDVKNTTIRRGTPGYVAPEVAFLSGFDCRADVFSLGCVLYEALTGERLFQGADRSDTYRRNAHVILPAHFPKAACREAAGPLREAELMRRVHLMLQPLGVRPTAEQLLEWPW